jgi:hypothetical protein
MDISNKWNTKYYNNNNDVNDNQNDNQNNDEVLLSFFSSSDDDDVDSASTEETNSSNSYRTVLDYNKLYKSKKAKPSDVMDNLIIGATTKLNHLNIFSCFRPYHIRKQALESDNRWKLNKPLSIWDGVPVAIKDQSSVSGLKTCYGSSECIEWYDNDDDDIPSEYLKKAGAIIIGMVRTYVRLSLLLLFLSLFCFFLFFYHHLTLLYFITVNRQ